MTRVVVYVRVSTDQQAQKGESLEAQKARCAAYAALYALDVVAVIEDAGLSAKSLNRPGLQRALSMLAQGTADALLVTKLDRLTRSVRDLGTLVEGYFAAGKSTLISIGEHVDTSSAAGRMMLNVLTSILQWEREAASERTRAVVAHKKAQGTYVNKGNPHYAPDTVAYARELRADGMSVPMIARMLNAAGVRTSKGTPLTRQQVDRLLAA